MKSLPLIILLVVSVKIVADEKSCWLDPDLVSPTKQLALLRTLQLPIRLDKPEEDARLRMKHGDFRLLGIGELGIIYPGLENMDLLCKVGGRYIEGTSDVIEGEEHAKLMQKFREYAEKYNKLIISTWESNHN